MADWWDSGKRYHKMFDTVTAARGHLAEVRSKQNKGEYVAPRRAPLFKDAAASWLESRDNRAPGTYDLYFNHINRHLLPKFGELHVDKISTTMIEFWRAELSKTGATSKWRRPLAKTTIRAIVSALSGILDSTVRNKQLVVNPVGQCERVYSPRHLGQRENIAVKEAEILDAEEIARLLDAAEPGLYRMLFTLAAASGGREGELFALKWSDIRFDGEPQISIKRSLSWAKGPGALEKSWRFNPPKTKAGEREIPIDPATVHALRLWKMRAAPNAHNLVFAADDGNPLQRRQMLKDGFAVALKAAKLKRVTFHSLRHSYASGLILHGSPVTEVSTRLGHENVAITLSTYSHWFKGADSGAAGKYAEQIFGKTDTHRN
jgi:integrase